MTVDDAYNLDCLNRPFVGIRVSFVENQVHAFDEHSRRGCDLWPAHANARRFFEEFYPFLDLAKTRDQARQRLKKANEQIA